MIDIPGDNKMTENFLIVGGAGYIGAQVNKAFQKSGYNTVVLDNLSRGFQARVVSGNFEQGDVGDAELLEKLFTKYQFSGVLHFAAFIDVGESVHHPDRYYHNNVVKTLTLLNAMVKHKVSNIVFSSTAAVYGTPNEIPIPETHSREPINPYGRTKLIIEQILSDYKTAYGLNSCSLRYFNAAGGDPSNEIPYFKRKENNLIPILLNNILEGKLTTVFGNDYDTPDGTCIRDYIHIEDLATAHLKAMEKLLGGQSLTCYNLGVGKGFTVLDVITTAEQVLGTKIQYNFGERRKGDPAILVASSQKAMTDLSWQPKFSDLETIIHHAWNAMKGAV